jgi:transposase
MAQKSKLKYADKIFAIEEYKAGKGSYETIARKYGTSSAAIQRYIFLYDSQGTNGLIPNRKNKKYSKELKLNAVKEYLDGKGSLTDICKYHQISSEKQLRNWIKVYTGHKEMRESRGSGTEIYMTKGRKTTQQERAEIVAFCIEHSKDYSLTIQTYGVSYQQIYSWVRKYEENGVDGLTDKRGRTKPIQEMTEIEKLRAENRILQAKNYDLEIENAFIKKLKELEEGGR